MRRFVEGTLIFYAFIILAYWVFARPAHLSWGAGREEKNTPLPGDTLISSNRIVSTRAIDIRAPKEAIWPWIAQTGQNRGGFNSYHWLENLFGAKMENAQTIHLLWQNPQPGDTVYYGKNQGFALVSMAKPNEYYSLGGWTFFLQTVDTDHTKLIVRYPSMEVGQSAWMTVYYYGLFEPLHFIMESGMMMGIKQKSEINKYKKNGCPVIENI
jgi:hypothetical protein